MGRETRPLIICQMETLILAGGFGTRLKPRVPNQAKPLAPIGNRPFILYQLDWLVGQGIRSVILAVHYQADQFDAFAEEIEIDSLQLRIVREQEPLGTGGAAANAIREVGIEEDLLVINGDTFFNFSLPPILEWYRKRRSCAALIAAEVNDVARYGKVVMEDEKVVAFEQATGCHEAGIVSCGAYILRADVLAEAPEGPFSIEKDFFPRLAQERILDAYILRPDEEFFDIGTPEAYNSFCERQFEV